METNKLLHVEMLTTKRDLPLLTAEECLTRHEVWFKTCLEFGRYMRVSKSLKGDINET